MTYQKTEVYCNLGLTFWYYIDTSALQNIRAARIDKTVKCRKEESFVPASKYLDFNPGAMYFILLIWLFYCFKMSDNNTVHNEVRISHTNMTTMNIFIAKKVQ